jgi:hypothetical protein
MTSVALVAAIGVAGCGYTPEQRAASGALIGAGTGAAIASAAGGRPGAVIAGSLLGAGAGAVIGANTRPPPPPPPPPGYYPPPPGYYPPPPPPPCGRVAYDPDGRPMCVAAAGS